MTKADVTKFFDTAKKTVSKRSPEILIALGVTGFISTTVLAVKATPKALQLIEERKKEERTDKLTVMETVQTTWKCYIPAVVTGTVSAACVIGANSVHAKRNAALATAYKLSETAFREFKDKAVEEVGEKKVEQIYEKIAQDRVTKSDAKPDVKVEITGKGEYLYQDPFGRRFYSSRTAIDLAIANINLKLHKWQYVSLNDFYEELGLESAPEGDELGWNLKGGEIDINIKTATTTDGNPCGVLMFTVRPDYEYERHW